MENTQTTQTATNTQNAKELGGKPWITKTDRFYFNNLGTLTEYELGMPGRSDIAAIKTAKVWYNATTNRVHTKNVPAEVAGYVAQIAEVLAADLNATLA